MKIALILSSNIKYSPYLEIFRKVLADKGVDFDVISWDRESLGEEDGIVFKYPAPNTCSMLGKFLDYYKFAKFAKGVIRKEKYDKLIVFGAAIGVFLYEFLNKNYQNNFWFDYRDLTIEQKFMGRFKKLCDISDCISISSPGFKEAFPAKYDFILSHNFDIDEVRKALVSDLTVKPVDEKIVISTIGGIRDYDSNVEVIKKLANRKEFFLRFIGKGHSAEPLNRYVVDNKIDNVGFQGFYLKKDEYLFYEQTDLVNIYYPRIKSHETALSNRFYKSMIFRKPMIVTNRSTQGDYAEKYGLGLVLEDCSDLDDKIMEYMAGFDPKAFAERCNALLNEFVLDYENFYSKFLKFICHE